MALAGAIVGTTTSAVVYLAKVKSRVADLLMRLSLRDWSRLMPMVRFTRKNITVKVEPVCRFWSGPPCPERQISSADA
jgi:hypothetical protein